MNPFQRSNPLLNSSDRTRNQKSKYIYAATKNEFQTKRKCKNRNTRLYKNGKIRSTVSYDIKNSLSEGNIMCNNCDQQMNKCGTLFKNKEEIINMYNNSYSELNGGGVIKPKVVFSLDPFPEISALSIDQSNSNAIITSDVSGNWNSSPYKTDISMCSSSLICPYGYIDNLINIPRNLDGSGILIDPHNVLFTSSDCITNDYLSISKIKTTIVMKGTIDLSWNYPIPNAGISFESADSCEDPSYNTFVNRYVQLIIDDSWPQLNTVRGVFYGIVKKICCLNEIDGIPWMEIHIEVINIGNLNDFNSLISKKPIYRGVNWKTTPTTLPPFFFTGLASGPFKWSTNKPWVLVFYRESKDLTTANNAVKSVTVSGFYSDINVYQGVCNNNLTQTNSTKRTYMSCLENQTKTINFAITPNLVNNN